MLKETMLRCGCFDDDINRNERTDDVDKVFIFYSLDPWIKSKELKYRGRIINFPKNPESVEMFLKKKIFNKYYRYAKKENWKTV